MIEQQIRPWDVLDPAVLSLLAAVRREDFVPPAYRALAFVDTEVPLLPASRRASACSRPRSRRGCCRNWQVAAPRDGARDRHRLGLHGRAAGAPGAARASRWRCRPELARMARDNLRRDGDRQRQRARVSAADGARGLPGEAPFDVIVLSGSVAEVPPALLAQLKVGGRLVAIVGELPMMRARAVHARGRRTPGPTSTSSTPWRRACTASTSPRAFTSDARHAAPPAAACRPQSPSRRAPAQVVASAPAADRRCRYNLAEAQRRAPGTPAPAVTSPPSRRNPHAFVDPPPEPASRPPALKPLTALALAMPGLSSRRACRSCTTRRAATTPPTWRPARWPTRRSTAPAQAEALNLPSANRHRRRHRRRSSTCRPSAPATATPCRPALNGR